MNRSLRWMALAGVFSIAAAGCQKKEETADTDVSRAAESKLPEEDRVTEISGATGAPAASVADAATNAGDQAAYEAWFKKYHLDLTDSKMLDADADEDGFSNRDEFLADTDPHDKNARPGIHKSIRLKEYNEVRLPLVLEGIEGDKARIRRSDQPSAKAVTVKAGDTIRGLPLKVQRVESKQDIDKSGDRVDLSQVALEDSSTHEKIVLLKDLPAKTSASFAVLVSGDGKTTLKVRKGDVFTWPAEQGATYKVVDLSQDQAVLQQVETKKTWTIPRM